MNAPEGVLLHLEPLRPAQPQLFAAVYPADKFFSILKPSFLRLIEAAKSRSISKEHASQIKVLLLRSFILGFSAPQRGQVCEDG